MASTKSKQCFMHYSNFSANELWPRSLCLKITCLVLARNIIHRLIWSLLYELKHTGRLIMISIFIVHHTHICVVCNYSRPKSIDFRSIKLSDVAFFARINVCNCKLGIISWHYGQDVMRKQRLDANRIHYGTHERTRTKLR